MHGPEDCTSLDEIRAGIDALDEQLVALVARRMRYIARAAELKTGREQIRDDARVEDIVAKVRAQAEHHGLRPDLAERVWRELMETSIAYEHERFTSREP